MQKAAQFAPGVVRWGIGLVFLAFGIWQIINPVSWFGYLPVSLPFGLTPAIAIHINAAIDSILGLLLITGLFTRIAATLAFIHLGVIVLMLGWNDVAVRDIGLMIVLVGVFLHGSDQFCIDTMLRAKKS